MSRFKPGDVFSVRYPFVREDFEHWDADGPTTTKTWRPGVSMEAVDCYETNVWADSEGYMVLTVIDTFKPGRFPSRVFYTRHFIDPDGTTFGKGGLKICTTEKFGRISQRYQYAYDVEETLEQAAERRGTLHNDRRAA